jgi:hypothetical protein
MIIVVSKNWVTIKGAPSRNKDDIIAINVNDITSIAYNDGNTIVDTQYDDFKFAGNYVEILVSCIERAKEFDSHRKTMEFNLKNFEDPLHPKPNRTEVNNFDDCEPVEEDEECELPKPLKTWLDIMKIIAQLEGLKKSL